MGEVEYDKLWLLATDQSDQSDHQWSPLIVAEFKKRMILCVNSNVSQLKNKQAYLETGRCTRSFFFLSEWQPNRIEQFLQDEFVY